MLDEESQKQRAQERAEAYVESIFMHTGEAVETFVNYFELDVVRGVMSPKVKLTADEIEELSNGQLFLCLINSNDLYTRANCASSMRRRIRQLAQQHGVIDNMIERVANDIYNSEDE